METRKKNNEVKTLSSLLCSFNPQRSQKTLCGGRAQTSSAEMAGASLSQSLPQISNLQMT